MKREDVEREAERICDRERRGTLLPKWSSRKMRKAVRDHYRARAREKLAELADAAMLTASRHKEKQDG